MTSNFVSQPGHLSLTSVRRVLIVEDFEPFRQILCALLRRRADVRIVGEASDGLDAIAQAKALRPDIVVLDINLPRLSGIDAAVQIHSAVPDAKLLFVTNEPSLEVVHQAFSTGAHGYVYKPRVHRDVLAVLEAILDGARFISGGLERIARGGNALASHRHHVLFASTDAIVVEAFSRFIARVLGHDGTVIALMTKAHDTTVRCRLQASPVDVTAAIRQNRYIVIDVEALIEKGTVNGRPEATRLMNVAGELLTDAEARAAAREATLAACGECAPTLWAQGHFETAIELEHLWDELALNRGLEVLCPYRLVAHAERDASVQRVCAQHTTVEIR